MRKFYITDLEHMFFFRKKEDKIIRRASLPVGRRRNDKPLKFGRVVFYLLLFLFLGITAYVLIFSAFMKVKNCVLSGTSELSHDEALRKAKSSLEGNFFGFIPRNNFFLVSRERIKRSLTNEFKKIKEVEIKKIFPQTLIVNIAERKSLIVWCSAGPCYILDEQGYAYTGTDLDSPEVVQNNLIKIIDTGARPVILGEKILSEEYIRYLINLREETEKASVAGINSEWITPSIAAEELEIITREGWKIFFSAKITPVKAVRTLKTFLEEEIDEEKRKKLDYVDLRVENKVYYKLKNEDRASPLPSGED